MGMREETTGKFMMNNKLDITPEMIDQIAMLNAKKNQNFERELKVEEEEKRQELWKDKSIMPFGFNIMIDPYKKNPYLKQVNEVGLMMDNSTYKSNETGENETLDLGIPCAKVIEVGPDVKHVKRGDEIIYMADRVFPVPFMNQGFLIANEGAVICIINTDANLKSRFKNLE